MCIAHELLVPEACEIGGKLMILSSSLRESWVLIVQAHTERTEPQLSSEIMRSWLRLQAEPWIVFSASSMISSA